MYKLFGKAMTIGALALCCSVFAGAQRTTPSKVWRADQGDGTYINPVLYADYSDPDAIRVGSDYYLVSSSFDQVPGLPILHSKDLVNWELIGHALPVQPPVEMYSKVQHGNGVWAPTLRFHAGEFYIYYPDPEIGIYVTKAKNIAGPWTEPKLIKAAKGWIDSCPMWDDDGNAYLINGMAASRTGIKNELILSRMSADGEKLLDEGTIVIDGHATDRTLEGPKLYKRNGYYYVLAPAGGVPTGYQLAFRSKNIYGPYERKVVMAQGKTAINGPHQGAWIHTVAGEDWFLHFQDRGVYGRVTLLEPMKWVNDWPVIGVAHDGETVGEPVLRYKKPAVATASPVLTPADSDEFSGPRLGLQWQWQANPAAGWALPSQALGVLRMLNVPVDPSLGERLWTTPNVLTQKLPAAAFTVTTKLHVAPGLTGDRSGLVLLGMDLAYVGVRRTEAGLVLVYGVCKGADTGAPEVERVLGPMAGDTVYLRMKMSDGAKAEFFTSVDGVNFASVGETFQARVGVWIGAKVGLFAQGPVFKGERGYVDVDWFRFDR